MLLLRADPCSGLPRRRFLRGGLFRGWLRQPLGLRPLRARRLRRTRSGADGMFEFFERFDRSEEHTSELQSLMRISYAVFRLKKKNSSSQSTTSYLDLHRTHDYEVFALNNI